MEKFVGTQAVADLLGKPVTWVYSNAGPRGMPRYKIGNHWRYRLSEVATWMEAHAGWRAGA